MWQSYGERRIKSPGVKAWEERQRSKAAAPPKPEKPKAAPPKKGKSK